MDEIDKIINLTDFEEYVIEETNSFYKISGFISKQSKIENGYEKVIKIRKNDKWYVIFYAIYNNETKEQEMVNQLLDPEIENIKLLIKQNKLAIRDFEFYIKELNQAFEKSKQY